MVKMDNTEKDQSQFLQVWKCEDTTLTDDVPLWIKDFGVQKILGDLSRLVIFELFQ